MIGSQTKWNCNFLNERSAGNRLKLHLQRNEKQVTDAEQQATDAEKRAYEWNERIITTKLGVFSRTDVVLVSQLVILGAHLATLLVGKH